MVNRTIQVILLVLVVSSTSLVAQQDSAFLLKEIEVNSTVLESSAALSKISINSSTLDNQNHQKLTELISQNSLAFFKQYGYGNASTVSMRGLQDRHTKVLWNGLEINFLQLGSIDFNILPAAAFSKVSIQSGAMSALYGSGAIGGAILLESNLKNQKEGVSGAVQLSFGSFKSSHTSAAARIKGKKWSYGLSVFGGKSENNFPILGTIKTLEHAAQTNSGVIQNIGFKLNGKNSFKLSSWHQQSFREISPGFNPADTLADFTDENNRYVLTYKHLAKKFSISALAGYTFDVLHYKNRLINVDSRGTAQVFTQRAIFTYAFNEKLRIQAEGEARQEKATNVNYAQPETRQRYTTATKATYNPWSFYIIELALRYENITDFEGAWSPFLANTILLPKRIKLHAIVSRNYTIPTLNDLYWSPGGNPLLKPEFGWFKEAAVSKEFAFTKSTINLEIRGYEGLMQEWIQWIPTDQGYFAPRNLKEVEVKGVETSLSATRTFNQLKLGLIANYSYNQSTNLSEVFVGDNSVGTQLVFLPFNRGNLSLSADYNKWLFSMNSNFTGFIYTDGNNTNFLNGYHTENISLLKSWDFKKAVTSIGLGVNNLLNTNYQTLPGRPMPGRNYTLNISIKF